MKLTIWLKDTKTTTYIGGSPDEGKAPVVTLETTNTQIMIEPDKNLIKIIEVR